jgi:hypothetical protein
LKSKFITLLGFALFAAIAAFGTEKVANVYKTHKLTTTSVLVSCNDEREPVVQTSQYKTFIIVSCEPKK